MAEYLYVYNGKRIAPSSGKVLGKVTSPSPFDVLSDTDFNPQVQTKWSEIPNYASTYSQQNPASMLYRKVTVKSAVRIVNYTVNTNQGASKAAEHPFVANSSDGWPAAGIIYDTSLTQHVINNSQSGDTVGTVLGYLEREHSYIWAFITIGCDVTLQPGDYWWPLFPKLHRKSGSTQFGYHASAGPCDMLQLYNCQNPTATASNPPVYSTVTTTPYLHLTDADGNEYSV